MFHCFSEGLKRGFNAFWYDSGDFRRCQGVFGILQQSLNSLLDQTWLDACVSMNFVNSIDKYVELIIHRQGTS